MKSCALLCATIVLAATPSFAANKATNLSEAQSAVEANLKTSGGKAFDERVGKEFVEKHMTPLRQCKAPSGNDMTNFWLLLKLDKDGGVEEVLQHPQTKLATCARPDYLKDKFIPPPHPDYWVAIYLKLSN